MSRAPRRDAASLPRAVLLALVVTLIGHYGWELFQARWYVEHAGAPMRAYAWHCFVAALGDVVIAGVSYVVAALIVRAPLWALESRVTARAVVWIAVGLVITIGVEIWATAAGRWAYAGSMPTVLGVGWMPIAQWLIVPSVTLGLFRLVLRRFGNASQNIASGHNRS